MSEETTKDAKPSEAEHKSPSVFEQGDTLVMKPESNTDLTIVEAKHSYQDYKASQETETIAFQEKRRKYLKGIAKYGKFTVFLDTNTEEQYTANPILEPKYKKQITLTFNSDVSNRQYQVFNKLRAEVQDMERTSYGTIIDYKEMGVKPPEDFATIRVRRQAKEQELYDIGLRIFFKFKKSESAMLETIPEGMIDQMEMRSTRDLIDGMEYRLNLGIRESPLTSSDISSTKKNMSSSIA